MNYFKEVGEYIIVWIFGILVYSYIIYSTLFEVGAQDFSYSEWIIFSVSVGVMLGFLNGFMEVFFFKSVFRKVKFVFVVINKTFLFLLTFMVTVISYYFLARYIFVPLGFSPPHPEQALSEMLFSSEMQKHAVVALIISSGINFFMQIKKKMGKGVLLSLFFGRYHRPRQEERIVMFLDLTSSTAIAEKLDLYKYSSFLKDFFYDIDDAINESKGAVFQFVGDEVVILWDVAEGCESNNCIKFFFDAQSRILRLKGKYMDKYGVIPEFKAGIHVGTVVITEVGGSKQEIAYHGDTVNTAARIRSLCNSEGKQLLVSAELVSRLSSLDEEYTANTIGVQSFKGKENVVGLFSIQKLPA